MLTSPLFLRKAGGSIWLVLWIVIGVVTIAAVTGGAILSARANARRAEDLRRLSEESHHLAARMQAHRTALEHIVDQQLPAILHEKMPPPPPDLAAEDPSTALLSRATAQLGRIREERQAFQDAVHAAIVSLSRKVQASAHRIQEEAARMAQRHPTNGDVLETSMRVDHAAAQQARGAQSLAALCGESPGQQWHEALPLADVVRGAAGRITAYQRVEVAGDPGVAVSARVVEPLIHVVAELLANGTQSSPPTTRVLVSLRNVQRGAVIEIDDGGVGLQDSRLEQIREIASGRRPVGLADLGEIPQTGLAVVGTYVRRHGFRVDITESVYGGVRAVVLIPVEFTEPVAPAGGVAAGGGLLTRQSAATTAGSLPKRPVNREYVETTAEAVPPTATPASARTSATVGGEQGPSTLPRRRSRRGEAVRPSTVDQIGAGAAVQPAQNPEQAGEWMGALLGTTNAGTNNTGSTQEEHR
ncbi:ATP-binding protein [Amycolatopsis taiwanensis]|uniref:ATP-binding protein n=1 Tax=Amycolatopsis taiwanensis TaxID=342230 RepID=UPI0004AE5406|nr:ATP-binding protein [Amycolatopsis taiwanensis]